MNVLGWLLTLLSPAAILLFSGSWGLDRNTIYFLAIASSTVVMWGVLWSMITFPRYLPFWRRWRCNWCSISVVLSGLASDGFMLAMSVLGLGAVIVASGLSYRVLLMLLIETAELRLWQNSALLSVGFLLTPPIPSSTAG